jgi:UDP-4-amino-4-deoxy-L-arabinose-oxoglutarate aminotransferase
MGDACVLSFHATKLLATGEGGMALSARPEISARLDDFRRDRFAAAPLRVAPLSDLQSALGLSQLARYDDFLRRRRSLAERYFDALSGATAVRLPDDVRDRSLFYRFAVRSSRPFDAVAEAFAEDGVTVRRGVDALMHHRMAAPGTFPVAEQLFAETVSLPLYPSLSDAESDRVIASARRVFETR